MFSFLKLIRYKNLLMVLLTMILTKYALIKPYPLSSSLLSYLDFTILTLSLMFITAGGYIINDQFDVESDLINKPARVLIGKTISNTLAIKFYLSFSFLGFILGFILSVKQSKTKYCLLFLSLILALFLYSLFLKKIALFGNIVVGLLISFGFFL